MSLTDHQAETWLVVLSPFDVRHVNQAIIEIGLSTDPFPDLAKLVLKAQAIEREESPEYAPGRDEGRIGRRLLTTVAATLSLDV